MASERSTDVTKITKLLAGSVATAVLAGYCWRQFSSRCSSKNGLPEVSLATSHSKVCSGSSTPSACHESLSTAASSNSGSSSDFFIYFGSQSGTGEGFSRELEEEAAKYHLSATVLDLDDFDPEEFVRQKVVVLVIATYGEGDPTDNAVNFFKWLSSSDRQSGELDGQKFCVMSLGNRQYVNFCSCGRLADSRLEELGGSRVHTRGEGDDDKDIDEDFLQWKESGLWAALQDAAGKKTSGTDTDEAIKGPACHTSQESSSTLPLSLEIAEAPANLSTPDPLVQAGGADVLGKWYFKSSEIEVLECYELRQKSDVVAGETTKHLNLDASGLGSLDWNTADNLEVLPANPMEIVAWWAQRLGVEEQLDYSLQFQSRTSRPAKMIFPTPCTLREALEFYCDLCHAPSKAELRKFAAFVEDAEEREAVLTLAEDRDMYKFLTGEGVRLSLKEVFEFFLPSAKVDLCSFLQIVARQRSRSYTIASSRKEDNQVIGLCVKMAAEDMLQPISTILKEVESKGHRVLGGASSSRVAGQYDARNDDVPRSFRGSCSSMLCTMEAGSRLKIQVKHSSFRLPKDLSTPILMVGVGTGVAPFRAFTREFRAESSLRPKTMLLFGCQRSDVDYLYKEELEEASSEEEGALSDLVLAFSRAQQHKVYVQDKLSEKAAEISKWIHEEGGHIYVCGGTTMGASVRSALSVLLGSDDEVATLLSTGRYVEELW